MLEPKSANIDLGILESLDAGGSCYLATIDYPPRNSLSGSCVLWEDPLYGTRSCA